MPRAFLLALTLATLIPVPAFAQDAKEDPSVARMRKDLFFLASEECEGRGVGTLGLDLAAHYVAAQFKKAGLKPGGVNGTYFQPFPFATGAQQDGVSTIALVGPDGSRVPLTPGTDFQVIGTSAGGKVEAPLVFVGYGATAKGIKYDDYAGIDVKGKVVVAIRRLPRWNDKDKPFDGTFKDELAALDSKQSGAELHQAAAIVLVNDATELPKDGLLSSKISGGLSTLSTPFVHVKRDAINPILKAVTGKDLADIEKAIDADLKPQSAVLKGWTIELNVKIKRKEILVKNVIGYVDGNGPLANETVVVGAHYDHVGYGELGGSIGGHRGKLHPGADDNASGTTSMIELARRFAPKKDDQGTPITRKDGRRMVFMAFTAEENGLIGSRHYCRVAPLFPLKDTVAMFNLDMVGKLKDEATPKLLVEGSNTAKEFDDLVTKLNPGFDIIKKNSRGFFSSDQYNFYQQKIPVVFFWTGEHPDYHRPTDFADRINVSGMKRIADYAELVISDLRTNPKRPEYVPLNLKTIVTGGPGGNLPSLRFQPDPFFQGKGVMIDDVIAGGPADKAGIKKGDIMIELAGKAISNVATYSSVRATLKANVEVPIKIMRDNKELTLKITPVLLGK